MSNVVRLVPKSEKPIRQSCFRWDGSYLGEITKENIINSWDAPHNQKLYHLRYEEETIYCYGRMSDTSHQCICDELKTLFNLPKLGSHWFSYGKSKKRLIIWRVRYNINHEIQDELRLNELKDIYNTIFRQQIQAIFAFRDVIGVSQNFESMISIRCPRLPILRPYPMSYKETSMSVNPRKTHFIPNTIIDKWFDGQTISDVLCRMFKIKHCHHVDLLVSRMRTKIQNIIHRIDRRDIWIESFIIRRLRDRLMQTIDPAELDQVHEEIVIYDFTPGSAVPNSPGFFPDCLHKGDFVTLTTPTGLKDTLLYPDPIEHDIPISSNVLNLLRGKK